MAISKLLLFLPEEHVSSKIDEMMGPRLSTRKAILQFLNQVRAFGEDLR